MVEVKELGEFITNKVLGCKFVGLSGDGEVFVEFEHSDGDLELAAAHTIRKQFPDTTKVTVVVKPSIGTVKKMVDELNEYLEEDKPKKDGLLDIGSF